MPELASTLLPLLALFGVFWLLIIRPQSKRNKAMAEYAAEGKARQIKTEKLKAMRLAKEAEDREAALANPVVKKPARKKAAK